MVYFDKYMSVRISSIAEVAHDGESILYITHHSGARSQTRYEDLNGLVAAYQSIQSMLVKHETGKSIDEWNKSTEGSPVDLSLVGG